MNYCNGCVLDGVHDARRAGKGMYVVLYQDSERSSSTSSSSSTVKVSSISSSWPWIKLDEIECARNVD